MVSAPGSDKVGRSRRLRVTPRRHARQCVFWWRAPSLSRVKSVTVIGALLGFASVGCGTSAVAPDIHPPRTDSEKAAAVVVRLYNAAGANHDAASVCDRVAGKQLVRFRCRGKARIPRSLRVRLIDASKLVVNQVPDDDVVFLGGRTSPGGRTLIFRVVRSRRSDWRIADVSFGAFL